MVGAPMKTCSICSYRNEPAAAYCAGCGQALSEDADDPTGRQRLTWKQRSGASWSDIRLHSNAVLVLHLFTAAEPLVLPRVERLILGRAGASGLRHPDIDLSAWGAVEHGVSRLHAAIEIRDEAVFLTDLGSTNGTYLNGLRLSAGEHRVVCSGDTIYLGNLMAHLYFRSLTEIGH
jgi:hypothetical protein